MASILLHFILLLYLPFVLSRGLAEPEIEPRVRKASEEMILNGAPIILSFYNQTEPEMDGLRSAPGCPRSDAGYPWVYYEDIVNFSQRCFLVGQRGPCKAGYKIAVEGNSLYGFCTCDCLEDIQEVGDNTKVKFCKKDSNELAFDPIRKECYTLYTQGPCSGQEWLVKYEDADSDSSTDPYNIKCEPRKCPKGMVPYGLDCGAPFVTRFAVASINAKGESDCEGEFRYSPLLKRCVKRIKQAGNIG